MSVYITEGSKNCPVLIALAQLLSDEGFDVTVSGSIPIMLVGHDLIVKKMISLRDGVVMYNFGEFRCDLSDPNVLELLLAKLTGK